MERVKKAFVHIESTHKAKGMFGVVKCKVAMASFLRDAAADPLASLRKCGTYSLSDN